MTLIVFPPLPEAPDRLEDLNVLTTPFLILAALDLMLPLLLGGLSSVLALPLTNVSADERRREYVIIVSLLTLCIVCNIVLSILVALTDLVGAFFTMCLFRTVDEFRIRALAIFLLVLVFVTARAFVIEEGTASFRFLVTF